VTPDGRCDWRAAVEAAIRQGDVAEAAISARDLAALRSLPTDRRKAILDGEINDFRLDNLLPADRQALRESLYEATPATNDPIKAAAARREQLAAALQDYIDGYEASIRAPLPALMQGFAGVFTDPKGAAKATITDFMTRPSSFVLREFPIRDCCPLRWWIWDKNFTAAMHALYAIAPIADQLFATRNELRALLQNGVAHEL